MNKWGGGGGVTDVRFKEPSRTTWICPPLFKVVLLSGSRWLVFVHCCAEMWFQLGANTSLWRRQFNFIPFLTVISSIWMEVKSYNEQVNRSQIKVSDMFCHARIIV
jgi:hypothetical protein